MSQIKYLTVSLLFIFPFFAFGQLSGIDAALAKGNAADMGVYFASHLDVSIIGTDEALASDQAVMRLSNFFSKNVVKDYKREHLTTSQNGKSSYSLGDLHTASGTYRIYLYFDANQKISEVRIEK